MGTSLNPIPPGARLHLVSHGERQAEVIEAGQGPVVVLVHSSGMGARQWSRTFRAWSARYHLFAPNLLGYGRSGPWIDRHGAIDEDVALLRAVIHATGADRVHLVGHSYGGACALRAALDEPERVHTVSVFEPTAFGVLRATNDAEGMAEIARFDADPDFMDAARGGDAEWLRAFIDYWNQPGFWEAMFDAQRDALRAVGRKVFREVASVFNDDLPPAAYAALRVPTLVMYGEGSTVAGRRMAQLLADALPGGELEAFTRAGHMAPLTRARQVLGRIEAHLERHG